MELNVQSLQIKAGKYKVVINAKDAIELGVRGGDRVQLKDHSYLTAIVETGDMIPKGTVGVYQECCEKLGKVCPLTLDLIPTSRPNSVGFIKKMMNHKKLRQKEITSKVK